METAGASACARMTDGTVKCWGEDVLDQLAVPLSSANTGCDCIPTPVQVPGLDNVVRLGMSESTGCAVLADGTVRCWGDIGFGPLADGSAGVTTSTPVTVLNLHDPAQIAPGGWAALVMSCALSADGTVQCTSGCTLTNDGTAHCTSAHQNTLALVDGLPPTAKICTGHGFGCALGRDGSVHCWGINGGNLGDGTLTDSDTPVRVLGL